MRRRSFLKAAGAALAAAPAVVALKPETCGGCGAPLKQGECTYCGRGEPEPPEPTTATVEVLGALPGSRYIVLDGWDLCADQATLVEPTLVPRKDKVTFELPIGTKFFLRVRKAGWYQVEQRGFVSEHGATMVVMQQRDYLCDERIITDHDIRCLAQSFTWGGWEVGEFVEVRVRTPNHVQVYVTARPVNPHTVHDDYLTLNPSLDFLAALEEELRKYALITLKLTVHPYVELEVAP
jgi:hypothetical protein